MANKKQKILDLYRSGRKMHSYEQSDARSKNISFPKFCKIMDQALNPDDNFFNVIPIRVDTKRKIH